MKHDLINKKFGQLTVVTIAPKETWKGKYCYWICHCSCGKEKAIRSSHLLSGKTLSCGCLRNRKANEHPNWNGYGEISGDFFYSILTHAKQRNISLDVTIESLWNLFLKQNRKCAMSGLDLNFQSNSRNRDGTASLDRIDSSKGYYIDNVWWVHKDINIMKWDLDLEQFRFYCKCVSENLLYK